MVYPYAKFQSDHSTNNEDTGGGGCRSPNLNMSKKPSPITVNLGVNPIRTELFESV